MTNEEAFLAKRLFIDRIGATIFDVMVDPIGPIKMKSRTEWLLGTQGSPNFRGVRSVIGDNSTRTVEDLLVKGAAGIDVLYICDANFSERTKDPAIVANLRKAKTLIVHSWDATHPLNEVADIVPLDDSRREGRHVHELPAPRAAHPPGLRTERPGRSRSGDLPAHRREALPRRREFTPPMPSIFSRLCAGHPRSQRAVPRMQWLTRRPGRPEWLSDTTDIVLSFIKIAIVFAMMLRSRRS